MVVWADPLAAGTKSDYVQSTMCEPHTVACLCVKIAMLEDSRCAISFYLVQLLCLKDHILVFFYQLVPLEHLRALFGNHSNMEEFDKPQKVGPLCQEKGKHCVSRTGCVAGLYTKCSSTLK